MRHYYRTTTVHLLLPSERALLARYRPRFITAALAVTGLAVVAAALF